MSKLQYRKVAALTEPGHYGDGGGLYLHVDGRTEGRAPSKRWVFVYHHGEHVKGRAPRRVMSLGTVAAVPLAKAREEAARLREIVAAGRDPKAERDAERAEVAARPAKPTFREEAAATLETAQEEWRGKKTVARWNLAIAYAAPFSDKAADEVTTDDVLGVLKPIWRTKPEMAQKTRIVWERVLTTARTRANARAAGSWTGDNPARWAGHLQHLLSKPVKLSRGHHAAMAPEEVPGFMAKLAARSGASVDALAFTALTAVRTATTLEAPWAEFDLEAARWSIPVARMKNAEGLAEAGFAVFVVPLAPAALAILRKRHAAATVGDEAPERSALVFGNESTGVALSNNAMRATLIRLEYKDDAKATVHGLRSTFRVWAGRQLAKTTDGREVSRFSNETMEFALGHLVGSEVQRAYDRSDYLSQRVYLMEDWAAYAMSGAAVGS